MEKDLLSGTAAGLDEAGAGRGGDLRGGLKGTVRNRLARVVHKLLRGVLAATDSLRTVKISSEKIQMDFLRKCY